MFTPDGTEDRIVNVSRAAARMYLYHCRWRDHETGYSRKGFEHARADLKMTRATAYRAHKELLDKDWIGETRDGQVGLRGGSFKPVDKTERARLVWSRPREKAPETGSLKFETEGDSGLKTETENLKNETNRLKNETGPYKERARGSSSTSSSSSPATHTPPTPSLSGGEAALAARVCVVELRFEDYRDFARSTPGFDRPDAWAMKHWPLRDADVLVIEFLELREQVREARAPVERQETPYHVAAQTVASVARAKDGDVAGYIEQLPGVSEETRARLRQTFLGAQEQARAHAPP